MGLELTTDRYHPITSQTPSSLRHAALITYKDWLSAGSFIKELGSINRPLIDNSNIVWGTVYKS